MFDQEWAVKLKDDLGTVLYIDMAGGLSEQSEGQPFEPWRFIKAAVAEDQAASAELRCPGFTAWIECISIAGVDLQYEGDSLFGDPADQRPREPDASAFFGSPASYAKWPSVDS